MKFTCQKKNLVNAISFEKQSDPGKVRCGCRRPCHRTNLELTPWDPYPADTDNKISYAFFQVNGRKLLYGPVSKAMVLYMIGMVPLGMD